jgi:ribosomal protein L35
MASKRFKVTDAGRFLAKVETLPENYTQNTESTQGM